jgi:hypothetical protein
MLFLLYKYRLKRKKNEPLLALIGNSFIANKVFPLTAKYLNDVDVIEFANVDSSNQFRHISFFKCNTA